MRQASWKTVMEVIRTVNGTLAVLIALVMLYLAISHGEYPENPPEIPSPVHGEVGNGRSDAE